MQRPNGLVSLVFDCVEDALPMFVVLISFSFLVMGWGIKGHPLALQRKDMFPLSLAFCISIFLPPVFPRKPPLKKECLSKSFFYFEASKRYDTDDTAFCDVSLRFVGTNTHLGTEF